MEIYIVYDPLLEAVISAHKAEGGAIKRCEQENDKDNRDMYSLFEYGEYMLEE